jgi:thioredoxin-related protein
MKELICILFLFISLFVSGQGIKFEQGLTWDQVKNKAKAEEKYIFIDCYATWCGPCKEMDKRVYNNGLVGEFMNSKFISLKLQIDSSQSDNSDVKKMYQIAKSFKKDYYINVLPTYLFFSPDGNILHKGSGSKTVQEFILMNVDALNSNNQIYTLLKKAEEGVIPSENLPKIADTLRRKYNELDLALRVARIYMVNYLEKMSEDSFLTEENLKFVTRYQSMVTAKDRIFKYYYDNSAKVNSIMRYKDFSHRGAANIIYNEMIKPELTASNVYAETIDFNRIYKNIKKKFGRYYANLTIVGAKKKWYLAQKDTINYVKNLIQEMDITGLPEVKSQVDLFMLNNMAWDVFNYSARKEHLKKALIWIDYVLEMEAKLWPAESRLAYTDTKANLLYKLGRKSDAIRLEEGLVKRNKNFEIVLDKMKNNAPTWAKQ